MEAYRLKAILYNNPGVWLEFVASKDVKINDFGKQFYPKSAKRYYVRYDKVEETILMCVDEDNKDIVINDIRQLLAWYVLVKHHSTEPNRAKTEESKNDKTNPVR